MALDIYEKYKKLEDLPISTLVKKPDKWSDIKGVMHIVHGMSEHKGRYASMIEYFKEQGYICVISDLRGHGDNAMELREYGYFGENGAEVLVEDIRAVNVFIRNNYPDFPIIMYAHSMGSLIVKNFLKKYDDEVDFVFFAGPPSNTILKYIGLTVAEFQALVFEETEDANFIAKILAVFAGKGKDKSVPNTWLSHDMEVVEAYNEDEKCGFSLKINGYIALFRLLIGAYSKKHWKVNNSKLPVYFIAGKHDSFVDGVNKLKAQKEFFNKLGYGRTGLRIFEYFFTTFSKVKFMIHLIKYA